MTYRIQAEGNPRKRKVVHFNRLKHCGVRNPVDQQCGPPQATCPDSNTSVRRSHVPPPYVPDETDLINMDEMAADVEVAIPGRTERDQELHTVVDDRPVHADRPGREVRAPTWMRDFVS